MGAPSHGTGIDRPMPAPDPLHAVRAALARREFRTAVQAAQPHFAHPTPAVRAAALRLAGEALLALEAVPTALQTVQASLQLDPHSPEAWRLAARLFAHASDRRQAQRAWQEATRLAPTHAESWLALAELHTAADDLTGAVDVLSRGILRCPRRPDLALARLRTLLHLGALGALNRAVADAVQRFPRHADIRLLAARARYLSGDTTAALDHLEAIFTVDPAHTSARALRARYRTLQRDYAGARADAQRVLDAQPSEPNARLVRASISFQERNYDAALADLDAVVAQASRLAPETLGSALVRRGLCREAIGDYPSAMADLEAGQAAFERDPMVRAQDGEGYLADVARRRAALAPGAPTWSAAATWPTEVPVDWPMAARPPVFIFGFPRSGTTLVERILGAHPALVATDEANLLGAPLAHVSRHLGGRPAHALTDAEVVLLRGLFERRAARHTSTARVVDKLPLNIVHVALVRRVFPDAPILVMLRDPRDCVWSAFVQEFSPNPAMVHTTTLAGAARLYAATMGLWQVARTLPGLRATEVRYEDVVADLETGARALLTAAGLPWDPAVLDYRATLAGQVVRTPSFAAVGRPLTRSRVGRWRNLAPAMAPILPVLEPFVTAWGYPASAAVLAGPSAR